MGGYGHHHQTRQGRLQHGAAGGEGVGRGAGGRGDDQAVSALVGHEMPVHRHPQLHHPRGGAPVDHHVVQGQGVKHALGAAPNLAVHQHPMVFFIGPMQHGLQSGFYLVQGDVGDETQAALVDANEGHAVRRQLPAKAQHGAVTAQHQRQVAALRNASHIQCGQTLNARMGGRDLFDRHQAALLAQKIGQRFQNGGCLRCAAGAVATAVVLAYQGDVAKRRVHGQITSLKSVERMTMLDDRAKLLLKTLVERYIADGQPVGSRTLSRANGIELSPATVRNVMADLEELGLIVSPHTSAGRIPTAKGYRLFVDTMLSVNREQFNAPSLAPEQPQKVIASAANLLSSLSNFVGVVMAPRRGSVFRHIEFLRLSEKRVLVIIVSPDGDVQNRVIFTDTDINQSQLIEASNYLKPRFALGKTAQHIAQ